MPTVYTNSVRWSVLFSFITCPQFEAGGDSAGANKLEHKMRQTEPTGSDDHEIGHHPVVLVFQLMAVQQIFAREPGEAY